MFLEEFMSSQRFARSENKYEHSPLQWSSEYYSRANNRTREGDANDPMENGKATKVESFGRQSNNLAMATSTNTNRKNNSIINMDGRIANRHQGDVIVQQERSLLHHPHSQEQESRSSNKISSSYMIGMDGDIHSHKRRMRNSDFDDMGYSDFDDMTSETPTGSDLENLEMGLSKDDLSFRRSLLRCLYCSVVCVLAMMLVIAIYFPIENAMIQKRSTANNSAVFDTGPVCDSGIVTKATHQPTLQIVMYGFNNSPDKEEINRLEEAIAMGYNQGAGGCADRFERYMYGVAMVKHSIDTELVLTDITTTPLENVFQEHTVLMAEFDTKISCVGCSPENAFASEYPSSFGRLESEKPTRDADFGYRQLHEYRTDGPSYTTAGKSVHISPSSRNLQETPSRATAGSLSAGFLLDAIEASVRKALESVQGFREATIVVKRMDGSIAATSLHKEIKKKEEKNEEKYENAFFRNKIMKAMETFQECDGNSGKRHKATEVYSGKKGDEGTYLGKKAKGDDDDDDIRTSSPISSPSLTPAPVYRGKKGGEGTYVGKKAKGDDDDDDSPISTPPLTPPPVYRGKKGDEGPYLGKKAKGGGDDDDDDTPPTSPSSPPTPTLPPTKPPTGGGKKGGDYDDVISGKKCSAEDDVDDGGSIPSRPTGDGDDDDSNIDHDPFPPKTANPAHSPTGTTSEEILTLLPTVASSPTKTPSPPPDQSPTASPTKSTTFPPQHIQSDSPTKAPTPISQSGSSDFPTETPTLPPNQSPTASPTTTTTFPPRQVQSDSPTKAPTPISQSGSSDFPSKAPTLPHDQSPTASPTKAPIPLSQSQSSDFPTKAPTPLPDKSPTASPTKAPIPFSQSESSDFPTKAPTLPSDQLPTASPTKAPIPLSQSQSSDFPTKAPTPPLDQSPTASLTKAPIPLSQSQSSDFPTKAPTAPLDQSPTASPTKAPITLSHLASSGFPTKAPTPPPDQSTTASPTKAPIPLSQSASSDFRTKAPTLPPDQSPSAIP
ncbi:alpha-1,6-glucosidase [Nitzschia inconspicua]|uniref:Alpha-1,6-glucosidase n=1 Tax=Nitzschia inconspicua TaxID=303405 RepID=A0A9K3M3L4_9STRA|nr:alpha-1,6-glucosidase [Nitzschia inconspicua]